jgi:hypothetical protein
VTVEEKNRQMLDRGGNFEIKEDMDRCKKRLDFLQVDQEMTDELVQLVAPGCSKALRESLFSLKNPLQTLRRMHELIKQVSAQLSGLCNYPGKETDEQDPGVVSPVSPGSNVGLDLSDGSEKLASCRPPLPPLPPIAENPAPAAAVVEPLVLEAVAAALPEPPTVADASAAATPQTAPGTGRSTPFSLLSETEDTTVANSTSASEIVRAQPLYLNETLDLMFDRWNQISKDFYSTKAGKYDLTKVPDVYDMVKYDLLHNSHLGLNGIEELHKLAAAFENCVVPQEYGSDPVEKRYIGSKMCSALLEKINLDLEIALKGSADDGSAMLYQLDESHAPDLRINSLGRSVRTRLYFTSESHMHTLLNVLRFPGAGAEPIICKEGIELMDSITEVSYLSQIVIRLFEDRLNPLNFHCELSFSPGARNNPVSDKSSTLAPYVLLDKGISYGALVDHLQSAITLAHQDDASVHLEHRHGSVTVNMDMAGNSDNWEIADGAVHEVGEKKKKKDKKDKKDKGDKT